LQPVIEMEPIPMRPPGHFGSCYTAEEIATANQLAKASVRRVPSDLVLDETVDGVEDPNPM
jgi:hypothetical protein